MVGFGQTRTPFVIPAKAGTHLSSATSKQLKLVNCHRNCNYRNFVISVISNVRRAMILPWGKLRKIAEIVIACAVTWVLLDLTRLYVGREGAWAVGLIIIIAVIFTIYRRWKN